MSNESGRLGLRAHPAEDAVLSAILRDWSEKFGVRARWVLYVTDHLVPALEAKHGITPLAFGAAIRRLVNAGVLAGEPILGTHTHWHVQVPDRTWDAYEDLLVAA